MAEEKKLSSSQLRNQYKKLARKRYLKSLSEDIPEDEMRLIKEKEQQLLNAIRDKAVEERTEPKIIKNVTDKINTQEKIATVPGTTKKIDTSKATMQLADASDAMRKNARKMQLKKLMKSAGKVAGKGLKAVPLVGGLISALTSGDASAAIPILGDVDEIGPERGSPEAVFEDMSASPEERKKAIEALKKRMER